MADNALKHAIYLSNISEAEIIILNVVEAIAVDSSNSVYVVHSGND
jgi:hypothetical protein